MSNPRFSTQPASSTQRDGHPTLRTALVIFAMAPIPGQVKTHLCPPLTADEAATLHGSFVLDTLERTRAAVGKLPIERYLACAPTSTHVFFKILEERQSVKLIDQVGDSLGTCMSQSVATLLAKGYRQVIVIGTDIPTLPLARFKQTLTLLENHDVVLGPAFDGGYYLIGLKRTCPELFADISWSSEHVLRLTQEKAAALGLTTTLIEPWREVDTVDDLQALIETSIADGKKPKNDRAFSSRTAGVLQLLAKRLSLRA